MDTDDHSGSAAGIGRDCAKCGARLATDQRYCLTCGTRRGPLPAPVASTLHEMRAAPAGPVLMPVVPPPPPRAPFGLVMPTPRVASLLVMAMLSFGVVAGSLTGPGGVEALAHSFVLSLPPVTSASVATATGSGSGGGGGGSSGGGGPQQAITETVTEPAPSGGGVATTPASTPSDTGSGTGNGSGSGSAAVSLPRSSTCS